MSQEKLEKHEYQYINEDRYATQKDLKILSLELEAKIMLVEQKVIESKMDLEKKINSITIKLGSLIIACSGILFGLLSYFHK